MSTIIEMPKKIEKLPTSQLVFYMTYPELSDESNKSKIEATVFGRLIGGYKLYPDKAKKVVEREQEIITTRGQDLGSYIFDDNRTLEDMLKVFYESVELIAPITMIENNFNTLTISEITRFYALFVSIEALYKQRKKELEKITSKNVKSESKIRKDFLRGDVITSVDEKAEEFTKLLDERKLLELQMANEQALIGYNNFLTKCMLKKFRQLLEYGKTEELKSLWYATKEAMLSTGNKKTLLAQSFKSHEDINYDAYSNDTAFISQYNVKYPFTKKR